MQNCFSSKQTTDTNDGCSGEKQHSDPYPGTVQVNNPGIRTEGLLERCEYGRKYYGTDRYQ